MGRTSPVVAQFEFAARVRKRREELGLPAAVVSKHLGFTRNFYSAVENSRSLLATAKLPLLIEALQFDDADAQTLTTLLEQARTPGWWQQYASVLDDPLIQFLGLEYGASVIKSSESLVFNGLVQSAGYAESLLASSPNVSTVATQKHMEWRRRRQDEFFGGEHGRLVLLMGEALLWQQFGHPKILKEQLAHLVNLAERLGPLLEIGIRKFDTAPSGLQSVSTLAILEFDSMYLAPVVYREAGIALLPSSDPALVETLQINWSHALAAAASHQDSLDLLVKRISQID